MILFRCRILFGLRKYSNKIDDIIQRNIPILDDPEDYVYNKLRIIFAIKHRRISYNYYDRGVYGKRSTLHNIRLRLCNVYPCEYQFGMLTEKHLVLLFKRYYWLQDVVETYVYGSSLGCLTDICNNCYKISDSYEVKHVIGKRVCDLCGKINTVARYDNGVNILVKIGSEKLMEQQSKLLR